MAYPLPGNTFVGVDFSGLSVAKDQETIDRLGMDNVDFHYMDLLEVGPSFGQFDYIIAYGIYSWVPAEVLETVLEMAEDNIEVEQYLDFMRNRTFRETLL